MNRLFIFFIVILGGVLIFSNLSNIYLWQDEACVALISKNVLRTGIPLIYDGKHWLTSIPLESLKTKFVDTQTWLEYYLGAISFLFFGTNTFSARFPFAIFGFAGLVFSYFFYKKISSKNIAMISTSLIAFSIPYILYARQCSFYPLVPFLILLIIFFYLKFIANEKYAAAGFIISNIFLYYTFFAMSFIVLSVILVHFFVFGFYKERLKKLIKILFIITIFIIPSLFFLNIFYRIHSGQTRGLNEFIIKFKSYLLWINNYIFPFLILFILLIYKIIRSNFGYVKKILASFFLMFGYFLAFFLIIYNNYSFIFYLIFFVFMVFAAKILIRKFDLDIKKILIKYNIYVLLLIFIFFNILATTIASDAPYFRYLYSSLPILIFFLGISIYTISNRKILIMIPIMLIIIFSNILSVFPIHIINAFVKEKDIFSIGSFSEGIYNDLRKDKFKSDFLNYLYEITHDYNGPVEGIVKYLNQNAKKTDVVKTSYNDFPLMFYTNLHIINWKDRGGIAPDWIIPVANVSLSVNKEFLLSIKNVKYDTIELNYPNLCYSNLPEPLYHNFKTVEGAPKSIYRNFSNNDFPPKVTIFKKLNLSK